MRKVFSFFIITISSLGFSQKKWSLQECIDYAVENNLQVIYRKHLKTSSENTLFMRKKDVLPDVSASIKNSGNFGQGRDVFGSVDRNDNFTNSVNIGAGIELYNNGKLKKRIEKAQFNVQASEYDLVTIKDNVSLQIAQSYLQALLSKEVYKIAESSTQNAQRLYNRAKITTEVGTTPLTIQYEAEANLSREKQKLVSAKIDIERALFDLAQLLQLDDYYDFDIQDVILASTLERPLESIDNVVETAYSHRSEIKAAESKIKAAQKEIEIVKTNFYPSVTASAGLGTSYFQSFVHSGDKNFWTQYSDNFGQQVSLSVNIPIFSKGLNKLQVEQSKIDQSIAENEMELQKLDIRKSVQRSYFDANANYQNYVASVDAERSAKLALDYAEKSYEAGKTTIYDLNIARNNWVTARANVEQTKYNYIFSLKVMNFYAGVPLTL